MGCQEEYDFAMLKRKIETYLTKWKESEDRKPLVIKCIRRCGQAYIVEKSGHSWFKALDIEKGQLGKLRYMVVSIGKYMAKYNLTIPKELAEYE